MSKIGQRLSKIFQQRNILEISLNIPSSCFVLSKVWWVCLINQCYCSQGVQSKFDFKYHWQQKSQENQEKTSLGDHLRKIHKTFHHMVKTCSHQVPEGSSSKPWKDLAIPPRTQSHNLCFLQSHLTGGCYKCQYLPVCPRVFMLGTATSKKKARKQSLGTQHVGKYPARKTELRNATNNSIQKTRSLGFSRYLELPQFKF